MPASQCLAALPPEEKTLTSPPVIGSIVLLTQITITMALLCLKSGRQKAGNGWESRKGIWKGMWWSTSEKIVCVSVSPGQEKERGEDRYGSTA